MAGPNQVLASSPHSSNGGTHNDKNKKEDRTKLDFEVVQEGQYGCHSRDFNGVMVISSSDSVHLLEKMGVRKEICNSINFEKQLLIYVASGEKRTGGYGIVLKRVFQKHNDEGDLEVYAEEKMPGRGAFVTMALTLPFLVARVDKSDLEVQKNEFPAVWVDKQGKEKGKVTKIKARLGGKKNIVF